MLVRAAGLEYTALFQRKPDLFVEVLSYLHFVQGKNV
jgi:hypothetical protein